MKLWPPSPDAQWPMTGWAISDESGWLPGIYATEAAADLAGTIGDAALQDLSDRVCGAEQRPIAVEDLESL